MAQDEYAVQSFILAAADYCRLIETRSDYDRITLVRRLFEQLSLLINVASHLPNVEPDSAEAGPDKITSNEWGIVFGDLRQQLGPADGYWMVFDPYDAADHEAIMSSLADDLADIYRDLMDNLPNDGDALTNDALWNLKFTFEIHWGQHAVSALAALYSSLYGPHAVTS